jgi:hypothetical protein
VISRARMSGRFDWRYIIDRTRNLSTVSHWSSPASILDSAAEGYAEDKWRDQPAHVEVWVEKEALADVVGQVANRHDVGYLACRGYMSQSEQWEAGQRFLRAIQRGKRVVLLHLGDHDPSGIDMTRDIEDRLTRFIITDGWRELPNRDDVGTKYSEILDALASQYGLDGDPFTVRRIALNMDQVEEYSPPPNPAKLTDSRVGSYLRDYGGESWELDALDPATLDALIEEHILGERDDDRWYEAEAHEEEGRDELRRYAQDYRENH